MNTLRVDLKDPPQGFAVIDIPSAYFPYQPYPEQIQMMRQVHKVVIRSENALIESPTGTGKTLCLLVGVLSALHKLPANVPSKLYYLTRTHTQAAQIIAQLNKTTYLCRSNVLASREQYCVNDTLTLLKNKTLDRACAELCSQQLCPYAISTTKKNKKQSLLTIQQLKVKLKKQFICPYYWSRKITDKSQVTIMPFNYLLDCGIVNGFDVKNSVIVFDEAHNIDLVSEEGSSLQISTELIYQSVVEIKRLLKIICNKQCHQIKAILQQFYSKLKSAEQSNNLQRKILLQKLYEYTNTTQYDGIDLQNHQQFILKCKTLTKICFKKTIPHQNIQSLIDTFTRIYAICKADSSYNSYISSIRMQQKQKVLKLRCLDPSLSFKTLLNSGPRTVILSSGTLGALSEWQSILKYPIHTQLAIKGFITRTHLYAQVVPNSLTKECIYDFSFQHKHNTNQYLSLVSDLKQLQKVVPNGIVVAFSTYQLMQKTLQHSHTLSLPLFYQSKQQNVQLMIAQYSQAALTTGAYIFIIMKGRFSEGFNFSGALCRCLVVVGIPYLPYKDTLIKEKMQYIEQNRQLINMHGPTKRTLNNTDQKISFQCSNSQNYSAESWYKEQTFKVLNQTVGRVIRNKMDYGAVLLMDRRYSKETITQSMSEWFRDCIRREGNVLNKMKEFFKGREQQNCMSNQQTKLKEESHNINNLHLRNTPKVKKKALLIKEEIQKQYQQEQNFNQQQKQKNNSNWIDYFVKNQKQLPQQKQQEILSESEQKMQELKNIKMGATKKLRKIIKYDILDF